jgi:predicted MFS family arabinose efflux permease
MARNLLSDPADAQAGLATFGIVAGATAVGFAVGVLATPVATQWMTPQTWIVVSLGVGVASQLVLLPTGQLWSVCAAAGLLGMGAQAGKIAVDTIVQRDTDDDFRGRAFATYDVLYNAAYVGAAALGAAVLPDTGYSRPTLAGLAVVYVVAALAVRTAFARTGAARGA